MICPLRSGKWTRWVNEQDLQQREKEDWAGKGLKSHGDMNRTIVY
jgi:hypothetical protein